MIRSILLAAAILAAPTVALADEVWSSTMGQIVYEADLGDVAVLSFATKSKAVGKFYFSGLGGNFDDRGTYEGYWIIEGDGNCLATLTGADGVASTNWGRATITFEDKAFPSAWTLVRGRCFAEPTTKVHGEPLTGN